MNLVYIIRVDRVTLELFDVGGEKTKVYLIRPYVPMTIA
jgi:hypothetical protein